MAGAVWVAGALVAGALVIGALVVGPCAAGPPPPGAAARATAGAIAMAPAMRRLRLRFIVEVLPSAVAPLWEQHTPAPSEPTGRFGTPFLGPSLGEQRSPRRGG